MTDKEILLEAFKHATVKEMLTVYLWSIFNRSRFSELKNCIFLGMHLWAAMDMARSVRK